MGRASFKGTDYSSFFAGLYQQVSDTGQQSDTALAQLQYQLAAGQITESAYAAGLRQLAAGFQGTNDERYYELLKAAAQADAKAKGAAEDQARAQQSAADQEMADRWDHGYLSNDEWLSYIAGRVSATAGDKDPALHEQWVEAQRQYTDAIADTEAELAYQQGGSINDLVSHYRDKLGRLVSGTTAYEQTQERVNNLLDQRSATNITEGADQIALQIKSGKASRQDLLKFYQDQLYSIRPNSDLERQVRGYISDVQGQIEQAKTENELARVQFEYDAGRMNGAGAGKAIRVVAEKFRISDPGRYYQLLSSAVGFEKNYAAAGRAAAAKAFNAFIDGLQSQQEYVFTLVDAYNKGYKVTSDPAHPGKMIALTPDLVRKMDQQALDLYETISKAYETHGDPVAAKAQRNKRSDYIVQQITAHNTMVADDIERNLTLDSVKLLADAAGDPDPQRGLYTVTQVARRWATFTQTLQAHVTQVPGQGGDTGPSRRPPTTKISSLGETEQYTPNFVARVATIAETLMALSNPQLTETDADAIATKAQGSLGGDVGSALSAALFAPTQKTIANLQGLASGELVRTVDETGRMAFTETQPVHNQTVVNGSVQDIEGRTPALNIARDQVWVKEFVEVNGAIAEVYGVATPEEIPGTETWFLTKDTTIAGKTWAAGTMLTDKQVAWLDSQQAASATAFLTPGERPSLADWRYGPGVEKRGLIEYRVILPGWTDKQGGYHPPTSWVLDPGTGSGGHGYWYKDHLPIRGIQTRDDHTVRVDEGGRLVLDWAAYASAGGVTNPYAGSDLQTMQALADAGRTDSPLAFRHRDLTGDLVAGPDPGTGTQYFDPAMDSNWFLSGAGRDDWWRDDERAARMTAAKLARQGTPAERHARRDDLLMGGDVQAAGASIDKVLGAAGLPDLGSLGKAFGVSFNVPALAGPAKAWTPPAALGAAARQSSTPFVIPTVHEDSRAPVSAPAASVPHPPAALTLPQVTPKLMSTILSQFGLSLPAVPIITPKAPAPVPTAQERHAARDDTSTGSSSTITAAPAEKIPAPRTGPVPL